MCAWALRLAPAADGFYSRLLSEFDRIFICTCIDFLSVCRLLPGPPRIIAHQYSTAAIGMQEGDNHAFYCSLSEDNGHARSSFGGGSSQCRRSSQLVSCIASAGPL